MENAEGNRRKPETNLHRRNRRIGPATADRVRGQMRQGLAVHQPDLASELGTDHSVLRLSAGNSQGDLHDQRHRVD
jgi:hypothetical protein